MMSRSYVFPRFPGIPGYLGALHPGEVEAQTADGRQVTGADLLCAFLFEFAPNIVFEGIFGEDGRYYVRDMVPSIAFQEPQRETVALPFRLDSAELLVLRLAQAWVERYPGIEPYIVVLPWFEAVDADEVDMVMRTWYADHHECWCLTEDHRFRAESTT